MVDRDEGRTNARSRKTVRPPAHSSDESNHLTRSVNNIQSNPFERVSDWLRESWGEQQNCEIVLDGGIM